MNFFAWHVFKSKKGKGGIDIFATPIMSSLSPVIGNKNENEKGSIVSEGFAGNAVEVTDGEDGDADVKGDVKGKGNVGVASSKEGEGEGEVEREGEGEVKGGKYMQGWRLWCLVFG